MPDLLSHTQAETAGAHAREQLRSAARCPSRVEGMHSST